ETDSARSLLRRARVMWANDTVTGAIDRLLAMPPPNLSGEITVPVMIDLLWANFAATGDTAVVTRIAELVGADTTMMGSVGGYARWTLASMVEQHTRVRSIVEQLTSSAGDPRRRYLQQVLDRQPGSPGQAGARNRGVRLVLTISSTT